jgi:hypothetical protein
MTTTAAPPAPTWERVIDNHDDDRLERTRVPGGWLYRSTQLLEDGRGVVVQCTESMVFVPDAVAPFVVRT